ncbi:MAG: SpoIID/LytB domain-containing protein [Acidimicrobiia bacterium]
MRRLAVASVAVAMVMFAGTAALASEPAVDVVSIELVGTEETRFELNDRPYAGPMMFVLHRDGIAVSERATIEQYLQGIAEMPFLWNSEALEAQAVAARTYLARTLLGGRRGDAAVHEYDICATSRCQVYRGTQLVESDHGDRWRDAVDATSGELVLYEGRPIEAVYTSMVGSRSRANQDVWASDPVPYLQPVDSPEVGRAPYATWGFEISAAQFVEILRADGMDVGGELVAVDVDDPPEGDGRTEITVVTAQGTDTVLAPAMKGVFNRHGDDLYPGSLPAARDGGGYLPEPLPSYTYELEHVVIPPSSIDRFLPAGDRVGRDTVRFDGEGWGHGVGMSQWGARIFADEGADHAEILAHYYAGAESTVAPELVPSEVIVGLMTERREVDVAISGPASLRVNGVPYGSLPEGEWTMRWSASGVALIGQPGAPILSDRPWPR